MKKVQLIILESNEETLSSLSSYFSHDERFNVMGIAMDGAAGLEMIKSYHPDAVLLSLVLKGLDGIGVLEGIASNELDVAAIVMGSFADDTIVNRVMSKGAKYYLVKPFKAELAAERILESVEEKQPQSVRRGKIDEEISGIFISIGIPPHIKGYNYLREGIKMTVNKPSIINNVTKELYPKIGEKFDTSASKVERAIRHAIEVAWNRGRIDAINAVFGARVYIGTEKPTNSEFIALVADKLILENMS